MPAHSVPALADCRTRLACGTEPTLSTRRHVLRAGVAAWLAPAMTTLHAQASWHPTERVTYVIGVAPGGTVDLYARGIKEQLEALKLVHGQTVLPENRVGAGGAIALQALAQQAGNGHWLGTFHTGAIAGAVTGLIKADVRQFPPVAMMVEETSVVAVRADAPLKSAAELVAALKANPASLKIAVAPALGQNTHMAIAKPLKTAGVAIDKLTIAPFRSSAESVTALLGGHVDVVSATAPVVVPHVQAGKLRILASAAAERGSGPLAEVPTWREQGVDAVYSSSQGLLGARGLSPAQIAYWEGVLRRVSGTPEWGAFLARNHWKPRFMGAAEARRFLDAEAASARVLLGELGLARS